MNAPGEQFIVSIKRNLHEELFDGAVIIADAAVSITGIEKVISLRAKRPEPSTPRERIDHASLALSSAEAGYPEEHHVLDGENALSRMIDVFMSEQQYAGSKVSYDIPDNSIVHIPGIASRFGIVRNEDLPGQYL